MVTYSSTASYESGPSVPELVVGDTFTFVITYDDSIIDTQPGDFGEFPGAITALTIIADPGNTGTFALNDVVLNLPGRLRTSTPAYGNRVFFDVDASGASLGANTITAVAIQTRFPAVADASGVGKTLAEVLGNPTLAEMATQFVTTGNIGTAFYDSDYDSNGTFYFFRQSTFELVLPAFPVPVMGSWGLLGLALAAGLAAIVTIRRNKQVA